MELSSKNTVFLTNMALYNLGCEAIFRGTVNILRQTISPDLQFVMPSRYLVSDQKRLADLEGIRLVPLSAYQGVKRRILRKVGLFQKSWIPRFSPKHFDSNQTLVVLSVGGDIYTLSNNDLPWDLVKMGDYSNARGVPFAIWGASMESFEKRPDLRETLLTHLRSCLLITSRDRRTTDYLASYNITENVRDVFDPAFCMDPIACDIEKYLPEKKTKLCVGLNLSPLSQRYHNRQDLTSQAARTAEKFIEETGQSLVLVSHVFSPFHDPGYDDRLFHETVFQQIAPKYRPFVGRANEDIGSPRIKYLISQLDAYAGTRMHSTIAALSMCVPTLGLAYSEKAYGLNNMLFGHEKWLLSISDFTPEACCERLQVLLEEKDSVCAQLEKKMPEVREKSLLSGIYLKNAIELL